MTLQHQLEGNGRRFGPARAVPILSEEPMTPVPFFKTGTGMAWSLLRRLLHDLGALLLVGVVIIGLAGWLISPPSQSLRTGGGAEEGFDDRPLDRIAMSVHVAHVWLPERLVSLAKRESWSVSEERHQQLRKILQGEDWRVLFYAFTVQVLEASGGVESFYFMRYRCREPENVQELLDVMATAAGHPPNYPTTDYYSAAAVHVVPAGTSPQKILDAMKASSLSHDFRLPSP
jgi:hypothetical protein